MNKYFKNTAPPPPIFPCQSQKTDEFIGIIILCTLRSPSPPISRISHFSLKRPVFPPATNAASTGLLPLRN